MPKVEFRDDEGILRVYVDGVYQGWSCNRIYDYRCVLRPSTGVMCQIALVAINHHDGGYRFSVSFDGRCPWFDDWFKAPLNTT